MATEQTAGQKIRRDDKGWSVNGTVKAFLDLKRFLRNVRSLAVSDGLVCFTEC